MFRKRLKFLPALLMVAVMALSCGPKSRYVAIRGYAQGGIYTVKANLLRADGKLLGKTASQLKEGIDSVLNLIDTTLSGYNPASVLSRWNRGEEVSVDGLFMEMYSLSYGFCEETGGAFNVAAGELFDLWGFGFTDDSLGNDALASQEAKVRSALGRARMPMPDSLAMLGPECRPRLNFNAIAQGFSCDKVAEYLRGEGVEDMLVDIGEIWCDGLNPSGKPWSVGVDRPADGNNAPGEDLDGLWLSDGGPHGVVTSGNYRKFYVRDGRKYAHTIDPRTGWPVTHNLLSATIIAPDAATADAYATYCMVIGLEEAKAFIGGRDGIEGYLIYDEDGRMREWASENWQAVR